MSREIKFRAWTGSEMITPPNDTIGCGSGAEIIEISLAGFVSKRNAYGLDVFGGKNPSFDEPEKGIVLMQFTGLKDKNDVEIYEGDIVLYQGANGKVYYCSDTCMYMASFKITCSSWSFDSMEGDIEIIGNIHENPELL